MVEDVWAEGAWVAKQWSPRCHTMLAARILSDGDGRIRVDRQFLWLESHGPEDRDRGRQTWAAQEGPGGDAGAKKADPGKQVNRAAKKMQEHANCYRILHGYHCCIHFFGLIWDRRGSELRKAHRMHRVDMFRGYSRYLGPRKDVVNLQRAFHEISRYRATQPRDCKGEGTESGLIEC